MRRDVRWFSQIVAIGGMGLLTAVSGSNAQAPGATAGQNSEQKPADRSNSGNAPLSKKLDRNEGVLKPPQGIDPEIHQQPPAKTGDKMPVIIPPGEPGGDQSIQPK